MIDMTAEDIRKYIKNNLSEKRYNHSLGVAAEAEKLAKLYGADIDKAIFSGLAHDLAKEIPFDKLKNFLSEYNCGDILKKYDAPLIHGPAAAVILNHKFGIDDKEILDAVCYHTTGKENMDLLTKIIYVSDFTENGRSFPEAKRARELSYENLDEAIIYESGCVIINTVNRGNIIHPDTVYTRNFLLREKITLND